jgi:hypothetical protein
VELVGDPAPVRLARRALEGSLVAGVGAVEVAPETHDIPQELEAEVVRLRNAGVRFRNDIVTGPGGSQILLEDPSGNPIELFVPRRP